MPFDSCVSYQQQKGLGLIEVMVSVLIFVGGVLSVMGMQNKALRVNHDNVQRSHAVWLGQSAIERIKMNVSGLDTAASYQTESLRASSAPQAYCLVPPSLCTDGKCSAEEWVRFDVFELMCGSTTSSNPSLFQSMPLINPRLFIRCPVGTCTAEGVLIEVRVEWSSRRATKAPIPDTQRVIFSTRRN